MYYNGAPQIKQAFALTLLFCLVVGCSKDNSKDIHYWSR
jgi:hypothetical protein